MAKQYGSAGDNPPYYVYLTENELYAFLEAAGVRERDERILFQKICEFAQTNDTSQINIDEFSFELIHWAEINNYVRLRHLQNLKRLITQLVSKLSERLIARGIMKEGEIASLLLTEPDAVRLGEVYDTISKNLNAPFPTEEDLPFPIPNSFFYEMKVENFNREGISAAMAANKPVKISFDGAEPDLYCPRNLLTDLIRIAREKIRYVLAPSNQRTKVLDDIVHDLKTILPDKVVSAERILQILDGKENEQPIYLVNLATRFIAYMSLEREFKFKVTAVQAGKLLLNQKLEEEKNKQVELETNERKFDLERALGAFKDYGKLMSREDIYSPESEKTVWSLFSNKYYGASLRMLLSELLEKYTKLQKSSSENEPQEFLPAILKFHTHGQDYYIHRECLATYLVKGRDRISAELQSYYILNWGETMREGGDDPAMRFNEFFTKDLEKRISLKYPRFTLLMSSAIPVMNSVSYTPLSNEDRARFLQEFFTRPAEPIFKPYHVILKLNRAELYWEARRRLPFTQKFFLFRWFVALFRLLTGKTPKTKVAKTEATDKSKDIAALHEEEKAQEADREQKRKEHLRKEEIESGIERLKMEYSGIAEPQAELKRLEKEWNIKIGEVRQVLTEKIQAEIDTRTKKINSMLQQVPSFSFDILKKELENMADDMVAKAGNDVRSKKAYRSYILIRATQSLAL